MADTSGDDLVRQREALERQKRELMEQARDADRKIMELYIEEESEKEAPPSSDSQPDDAPSEKNDDLAKVLELLTAQEERSAAVQHIVQAMNQALGSLQQEVRTEFQQTASARAAQEEARRSDEQAAQQAAAEQQQRLAQWQNVIYGPTLAADPNTAAPRQQLIDQVLGGEPAACNLAGQLLQVQAAAAERLPQLLQDLGEALYAWRPKSADIIDPMEQAIVALVAERTEAVGGGNTLEVVRPGDRFDSSRHDSKARGAEVTAVHGWVVLRSNGKVYTRARVSVQ